MTNSLSSLENPNQKSEFTQVMNITCYGKNKNLIFRNAHGVRGTVIKLPEKFSKMTFLLIKQAVILLALFLSYLIRKNFVTFSFFLLYNNFFYFFICLIYFLPMFVPSSFTYNFYKRMLISSNLRVWQLPEKFCGKVNNKSLSIKMESLLSDIRSKIILNLS